MRSWSWLTKNGRVVREDMREGKTSTRRGRCSLSIHFFHYLKASNPTYSSTISCITTRHYQLNNKTFSYIFTMSSADDQYEQQNDVTGGDVPSGDAGDNDYKSRTGQSHIPVQSDQAPVEDPIDPATADSDETLGMPCSLSVRLPMLTCDSERRQRGH